MAASQVMNESSERTENLRRMLKEKRRELQERIQTLRQDQNQEALTAPGDVMDVAKSLVDVETHATLISRIEDQLLQLDTALSRVDQGQYGVCMNCGEDIPVERLEAVPFAVYCVDCQANLATDARPEISKIEQKSYRTWTPPPEVDENEILDDSGNNSNDELEVRRDLSEDEEEPGTAEPPVTPHARRPRRKK